jgi:hypothetical protein
MKPIKWKSVLVDTKKVKFTPNNYKIKTELGTERLKLSLKKFGLAGNLVINTDYTLIDGNSRLQQAIDNKEPKVWASMPDRKLGEREFAEMSALFDFAKAGEVDLDRIKGDLGTKEDFFNDWAIQMPTEMLDKLGKNARAVVSVNAGTGEKEVKKSDVRVMQIFMNPTQEAEFRQLEEKCAAKFGTDNFSDTVLESLKFAAASVQENKKKPGKK